MIYTLKKGKALARISSRGGQMIAFEYDGKDVLWTGDQRYWTEHAPMLFPVCCRLINGKIAIEGKEYSMPPHGFINLMEFEPVSVTETDIELEFHSNELSKEYYPYDFKMTVIHRLSDEGFYTEFKATNCSDRPMVYCIGAHPGFCTGDIEDWRLEFNKPLDETIYHTTQPDKFMDLSLIHKRRMTTVFDLKYEDFDTDALITIEPDADSVRLINKHTGKGYQLDFAGFSVFAVWTAPHGRAPYICLEPWNGLPAFVGETGNLEDKPYARFLAPGADHSVSYTVRVV